MTLVDPSGRPIASTPLSEQQLVALMVEELRHVEAHGPAILLVEPADLFRIVGLLPARRAAP